MATLHSNLDGEKAANVWNMVYSLTMLQLTAQYEAQPF
jgi:hypothetical protein